MISNKHADTLVSEMVNNLLNIAHQLFSQVEMHAEYGGVVPELASRDHIQRTIPLIKTALTSTNKVCPPDTNNATKGNCGCVSSSNGANKCPSI